MEKRMTHARPLIPDVPFHPDPTYRPPPKPIRSNMPRSQGSSQSSHSPESISSYYLQVLPAILLIAGNSP